MLRLWKNTPLTVTSYTKSFDPNSGTYGTPVVSGTTEITASVQPFREGNNQVILPEGVTGHDTVVIYTSLDNVINTADQFTDTIADTIEYRGRTFEAFSVQPWNVGLRTDHLRVVFIRQDQAGA